MQKYQLSAEKRITLGKKVKNLRKQGLLPATVYGKKVASVSIQLNHKDFLMVYKKARETSLVELTIDKEEKPRTVLVHKTQKDPISGTLLHADFYQVDLKQKVKTMVPVIGKGEAPAVTDNKGVLLHILSQIEIEALPTDLPEHIEVDLTALNEVDQAVLVKNLNLDKNKITVLSGPDETLYKIGPLITKEMEVAIKAEEEAKVAAGTAAAVTTEVPAPTQGPESAVKAEEPQKKEPEEKKSA